MATDGGGSTLLMEIDRARNELKQQIDEGNELLNSCSELRPALLGTMPLQDLEKPLRPGEQQLSARSFKPFEKLQDQFLTWHEYNKTLLSRMFSDPSECNEYRGRFARKPGTEWPLSKEIEYLKVRIHARNRYLESLYKRLRLYQPSVSGQTRHMMARDTVFIIHGHDHAAALEVQNLLRKEFGIEAVLMDQEPHLGRTLVEKFEEEAGACGFAIVILSPDDTVSNERQGDYMQMRPNVVFELGWFYGRLGRDRVAVLYKSPTEVPTDLHGVGYYEFRDSPEERFLKIRKELQEAGMVPDDE